MTTETERSAATAELARAKLTACLAGTDWKEEIDPATLQWLAWLWQAEARDTPAKRWANANPRHPTVCKFLRLDPTDPYVPYATHPFRVGQDPDTGKARILVAWPCPRLIDEQDDHLGIQQVLSWAPVANTVEILGDPEPQLAGAFPSYEEGTLFADPFAFFRAWVEARAMWAVDWLASKDQAWRSRPAETDLVPGCLMVGSIERIRWAPSDLPANLTCVGVDPRALNKAIVKAARLPFATNSRSPLRRAA